MDDDIDKALSVLTHIFDGSWRPRALAPDVLLQVCQDLVEENRVRREGKRGQDHSRGLGLRREREEREQEYPVRKRAMAIGRRGNAHRRKDRRVRRRQGRGRKEGRQTTQIDGRNQTLADPTCWQPRKCSKEILVSSEGRACSSAGLSPPSSPDSAVPSLSFLPSLSPSPSSSSPKGPLPGAPIPSPSSSSAFPPPPSAPSPPPLPPRISSLPLLPNASLSSKRALPHPAISSFASLSPSRRSSSPAADLCNCRLPSLPSPPPLRPSLLPPPSMQSLIFIR